MRMMVLTLAAVAALVAVAASSAAKTAAHPQRLAGPTNSTSSNWSGYDVTGGPFTSASASWTQPTVTCGASETSYSSFWVGLDGDTSSTVEQIGTDSDCVNGTPTYYAWYELYPKGSGTLVTIPAGAAIDASVTTDGSGNFTLSITVNRGTPITVTGKVKHASLASAEVIAEAPSSNHGSNGELGLADFGTVSFTNATVDGQPLDQNADPITMVQNGTTLAQPSGVSGGAFTVDWKAASGGTTHGNGKGHGH
jgi:hypothetical protein